MYALAETINGLYKAELIHRRTTWKTRESVELATLEWVGVDVLLLCQFGERALLLFR
ncbi:MULTISPECIES: hypothetical protein [unclassified Cupriavidus]|uniref:hypothetical protein n=1 Tax=Cupriavidus sp. H19C3 TaxID=3241603 RepID=UPI003BF77A43